MELESVVESPLAAVSTRDTLLVIPLARLLMKSGIQLSMSARGPSSGTEKCRKERILLARLDTADVTVLAAFRMPEAILPTKSLPQETAPLMTLETAVFAPVKALEIAVLMLCTLPWIAVSIFWKPVVTEVFRLVTVVDTDFIRSRQV